MDIQQRFLQTISDIIPESILHKCIAVHNLYSQIKTIEIWTPDTVNGTLKQIEFFWDSGIIATKDDALAICLDFKQEMLQLQEFAQNGSKLKKGQPNYENNYLLYLSDIEIGTNCILTQIKDLLYVFLSFNTFNKLLTSNNKFTVQTQQWMENLVKRSTLVSAGAEKYRYQFFRKIMEKVDKLENKIKDD